MVDNSESQDENERDKHLKLKYEEETTPEKENLLSIEEYQSEGWVPDGGWGWAVVIGGIIVNVYVGGLTKATGVIYLKLKDQFNQSAMATAWVFSLFNTFIFLIGPIASALCQRFSCRTVVFIGSILCFVGISISALAPNLEFIYITYSLVGGCGSCFTYTPGLIIVTNYFNRRRGLAVGISTAGAGLGMFIFPPLIESLFDNYGYKGAMLLLSAISLQSLVCAALFRPLDLHRKIRVTQRMNSLMKKAKHGSVDARRIVQQISMQKLRHKHQKTVDYVSVVEGNCHRSQEFSSNTKFTNVVTEPEIIVKKSMFYTKMSKVKNSFKRHPKEEGKPFLELSLLKDFPFLTLCIAILLFTMSMMSTFVFLPPLAKSHGLTQIQSSYLISIVGVSDSIARFTSGAILDLKRIKRFRLLVYNGVMFGVGIVLMIMPTVREFVGFAIISACYGIFVGTYVAQKSVIVVDILGPEKIASSLGLLLGFQGIGSLVGPTISGLFRDIFGTYDEAFYFGGLGFILGGIVLVCGNICKIVRDRRAEKNEGEKKKNLKTSSVV